MLELPCDAANGFSSPETFQKRWVWGILQLFLTPAGEVVLIAKLSIPRIYETADKGQILNKRGQRQMWPGSGRGREVKERLRDSGRT